MVKSELVAMIARDFGLRKIYAEQAVSAILDEMIDGLARGDRVELRGFGTFAVRYRGQRKARNPRTGAPVTVVEKHVPVFTTGKNLRNRLNSLG